MSKTYKKIRFSNESPVFLERFARFTSKSLWSLFFLKKSRAILSRSPFCKERDESDSLFKMSAFEQKSERGNSQPSDYATKRAL